VETPETLSFKGGNPNAKKLIIIAAIGFVPIALAAFYRFMIAILHPRTMPLE
jgi:hypothetical protein